MGTQWKRIAKAIGMSTHKETSENPILFATKPEVCKHISR